MVIAALIVWFTRPSFAEVDELTKARLTDTEDPAAPVEVAQEGKLTCVIDRSRSRDQRGGRGWERKASGEAG